MQTRIYWQLNIIYLQGLAFTNTFLSVNKKGSIWCAYKRYKSCVFVWLKGALEKKCLISCYTWDFGCLLHIIIRVWRNTELLRILFIKVKYLKRKKENYTIFRGHPLWLVSVAATTQGLPFMPIYALDMCAI